MDRATFASFLPARNREAVEHLQRISAGQAAGTAWVCGPEGCGKSHLLQAVCARAAEQQRSPAYFPLGEVANLGSGILEGLSQLDCVCLDDLDRVVGELTWERSLFALLREQDERGACLAIGARSPPALLPWKLADLGSRCAAAPVFQLRALDEDEQRSALQLRARLRGFDLPEETCRWLLRRFPRDPRTLYGLLDTLDEAALIAQRRLTVPFIRSVLRE